MRIFWYILLLLLVILGITFAYLNATPVVFNYYIGTRTIPLSLLLLFALGIGILLSLLGLMIPIIRLKSKNLKLQRHLKRANKEVENLRSIPVTGKIM